MNRLLAFDLDGTLIDSVGGIAASVNRTRRDFGFAPLSLETITSFTGDGAKKLIERSFADVGLPVPADEAVAVMVRHYAADPVCDTELYPGVYEGMTALRESGWILTVVSNKPQVVGERIIRHFDLAPLVAENIGGGGGFPLKPAPDALFHLLKKYAVAPENARVIGDNHTDMDFAANAGLKGIFCRYGFGVRNGSPAALEVDSFAECAAALKRLQMQRSM